MAVPKKINNFLKECKDECDSGDSCYDIDFGFESHFTRCTYIPYAGYDGFIPFTDGGYHFHAITDLGTAMGSGSFPEVLRIEMDRQQEQVAIDFKSDYPQYKDNDEFYNLEEFQEYERECLCEGSTFTYDLRIQYYDKENYRNNSGKDELHILAGYNLDYDYLRDAGFTATYEKIIVAEGLTLMQFKKYLDQALESIK